MESSEPFRILIPEDIGPFRLVTEIGSGGNGVVFLAERTTHFAQRVAIKVFYPDLFPAKEAPCDSREAAALSSLKHPGIVSLLDSGVTPSGLRYLVMEFVDGDVIDVYCDQQQLTVARRIEVSCEILDALEYAHRRLVIHTDLKPDNIRVTSEGRPRLLDFGTSTLVAEAPGSQSAVARAAAGSENARHTRMFASPEQRRGERLTIASDLYSMGLILRQILTGVTPAVLPISSSDGPDQDPPPVSTFKALASLEREKVDRIARNRSTTPGALRESLGPDLDAIFERALRIDPAERFASAQEMREELERFKLGYPLRTRPAGPLGRLRKWALRNRLTAGFAAVFLFAVCLGIAGVAWRTAEATREREIARNRLDELVRLTDSLAGELIGSVEGLPGSEAAQEALLSNAHQTIHALLAEHGDPKLQLELARQLQELAKLELARGSRNASARQLALDDLSQAAKLLAPLDGKDAEVARLRRANEVLTRMSNASGKTH